MASRLVVEILSDAKNFSRGITSAQKDLDGFSNKVKQSDSIFGQMKSRFDALGAGAKLALAGVGAAAVAFARDSVRAATELGESVNAVNKVFGEASDTITEFGKQSAQTVGLANSQFNQLAVSTGSLLTNFGFAADQAAEETVKLAQRASDLASVFNTDVGDALNAINASLRGETEPIRRYGVSLSDAAIRAKAVELGLADTTAAVDQNGKAVAALELIYEQTNKAQGDFIETSGELANAQRIAAAEFENQKAAFGEAVTPLLADLAGFATDAALSIRAIFGDDQAAGSLRIREGINQIKTAAERGQEPVDAFADAVLHIATNADLTRGVMLSLAPLAGLFGDDIAAAGRLIVTTLLEQERVALPIIYEIATAFGIAGEFADTFATDTEGVMSEFLGSLGVGTGGLLELFEGLGAEQRHLNETMGEGVDTVGQFDVAVEDAASNVISNATKLIGPFGELNDELFTATQRGRTLADTLLEITDPAFRAAQAQGRLRDAAANLSETQKDSEASAEDVAQATLDYASAVLEADAANAAFEASGIIEGLEGIGLALGEDIESAAALLEILGVLDAGTFEVNYTITGKVLEVPVDPRSLFPEEDQQQIIEDAIDARRPNFPTLATQRQHGGPVSAGSMYLVGERGPELFVPPSSGYVMSNAQSFGSNVTINVTNPTTRDLDVDLARSALLAGLMTQVGG